MASLSCCCASTAGGDTIEEYPAAAQGSVFADGLAECKDLSARRVEEFQSAPTSLPIVAEAQEEPQQPQVPVEQTQENKTGIAAYIEAEQPPEETKEQKTEDNKNEANQGQSSTQVQEKTEEATIIVSAGNESQDLAEQRQSQMKSVGSTSTEVQRQRARERVPYSIPVLWQAACLIVFAVACDIAAIATPWWEFNDPETDDKRQLSLFSIRTSGGGSEAWGDYCASKGDEFPECRGGRSAVTITIFMGMFFAVFAAVLFFWTTDSSRMERVTSKDVGQGKVKSKLGLGCLALSIIFTIAAGAASMRFPNDTRFKDYGYAFLLTWISVVLMVMAGITGVSQAQM